MSATISIILDIQRMKRSNKYPMKLRVTFSTCAWCFIQNHAYFRQRKQKNKLPEANIEFNYTPFQKKFPILLEPVGKQGTISYSYSAYIKKLLREGRIGTAINYQCSYISLRKFKELFHFHLSHPRILLNTKIG
jgi:hypothetical protein